MSSSPTRVCSGTHKGMPLNEITKTPNPKPSNPRPHTLFCRPDMNRFELLEACRRSIPPPPEGATTKGGGSAASGAGGGHRRGKGGLLHLRDIRCLQGVSEPAILVRRDAIVVSLEPVKAIITCECCFVVLPDGADSVLEPLLGRLREGNKDENVEMPFEFVALEALLVTLVNSHATEVTWSSLSWTLIL